MRPALIVHGGAGRTSSELNQPRRDGCAAALDAGWAILSAGGWALDAVAAAVRHLEDDPAFNAGRGACLTETGEVELDASVMEGTTMRAGAVAAVQRLRNPLLLARYLLEEGRHAFMVGRDAEALAPAAGLSLCAPESLVTHRQRRLWGARRVADAGGTVGAAAVDRAGRCAAATSTGGVFGKRRGRVGDSAVIGAGTYADDRRGAASATGDGEAIICCALATFALGLLAGGRDPQDGADRAIRNLSERTGREAGIVIVDPFGRIGHATNAPHMVAAYRQGDGKAAVTS